MDVTDGNIDQITKDIKGNYKDIRSLIDSRRSSRSSTRASSRRSSRESSPSNTEEVLQRTSSELERHKKRLEQIEQEKEKNHPEANTGQKKLKRYTSVADIMETKAIILQQKTSQMSNKGTMILAVIFVNRNSLKKLILSTI